MKPRLNIVTLGVADLPRSRQFYQDAFDWKPAQGSSDKIVFFHHGGIVLGLYPIDLLAEDAGVRSERSGFSGITLAINTKTRERTRRKPSESNCCRCQKHWLSHETRSGADTIPISPIRMDTRGKLRGRLSGNSTNREV